MKRLLSTLLTTLILSPLAVAQAPGHSPSRDIESTDLGAQQLDKIGAMVDRELEFIDERGYPFKLKQLFPGKHPIVLMMGYYECPAMCGQVLDAAFYALSRTDLQPGTDYRVLSVSINPEETAEIAANRKGVFLPRLMKTGGDAAWHLLVGDEAKTKALAESVGFQFYWSEATQQFAHPPSLIFLTPQGKVSRVIVNTYFEPEDVRLALVEASQGTLGDFWDEVKLSCLTFDSRTNTYSLAVMTLMRVGGAVTVIVLAAMIWIMLRRERRTAESNASNSSATGLANPTTSTVG
ncbi:MAG: protein SCO1/2 [Planctomycetota bacterium]|jgi:protein SCO1/2